MQRIRTGLEFESASLCISSMPVQENPAFILFYGRDPCIPIELVFLVAASLYQVYQVGLEDYRMDLTKGLITAWRLPQLRPPYE